MAPGQDSFVTREACEATSSQLLDSQEKLHRKLDSIEKRLFRDNGSVSIQTRLDRHEQVVRALLWVVGLLVGAGVTTGISCVVVVLRHALGNGVQ